MHIFTSYIVCSIVVGSTAPYIRYITKISISGRGLACRCTRWNTSYILAAPCYIGYSCHTPYMPSSMCKQPVLHRPWVMSAITNGRTRRATPILLVSRYFHYLHHRYFECNYGGDGTVPLDKWFGTWHDGTAESQKLMRGRRKQAHGE